MTKEEFVRAVKAQTSDAAVFGTVATLHRPPGRKPRERDVALSNWYQRLDQSDQEFVFSAMREAAELAVFSFFCVLDGVSAVESGRDKGSLELRYKNGAISEALNPDDGDPLHDLYNDLCRASNPTLPDRDATSDYAVGLASYLKSLQTSHDGLDIQPPPKAGVTATGEDDSVAILLPKSEHRKL